MSESELNWDLRIGSFGDHLMDDECERGRFVVKRRDTDVSTDVMESAWQEIESWVDQSVSDGYPIRSYFSTNRFSIVIDFPNRLNREWTQRIDDMLKQLVENYPLLEYYKKIELTMLESATQSIQTLRSSGKHYLAQVFETLVQSYEQILAERSTQTSSTASDIAMEGSSAHQSIQ